MDFRPGEGRPLVDVGEAVGTGVVDRQYIEGQYALTRTDVYGSEQGGYFYYHRYVRHVSDIWAGNLAAEAVLTLNDLDQLNADGLLDFTLGAPAGKTKISWLKLDFDLVSAVPEPATWAMMLVGFFGAGSALRARRRQGLQA